MSKPIWNWQTKVNRLRRIYEKNATQNKIIVGPSSTSSILPIRTIADINVTAESEWSTPTNISESFVKLINYSDFEDGTGDMAPVSEDDNCDVIYTTLSGIECKQRTENSLCDVESINNDDAGPSDKCSIECNTYTLSSQSCELANCIPVLELAKLNIGTLIDDHIKLLREKANSVQLNKNERVKQLKLAAVRRIIERRNCIQRMREEITSQMNRFHELLDELEKI